MSTAEQIHAELQKLGPEIIEILQDIDRTATPLEIWQSISTSEKKRFMAMAESKNSAVWELVAATWVSDAIFSSAKSLSASYEVALPTKTTLLLSDYVKDYFVEHGLEFVKQTTGTDVSKLKAWVWGQSRYADVPLLEQPNLSYIVDGGYARAARIKSIEMHRATMRGGQSFMTDAGFAVNTWHHMGDRRVRPAHRGNGGITVEVGKPFPNGEKYPGETSIGCRCWLEYSNDKVTKNASKVYKENLDNAAKSEKAAPTEPVTLLMKGGKVSATPKEPIARKVAPKVEPRKVTVKPAKVSEKIEKVAEKLVPPTKADLTYAERASLKDYTEEDYSFVNKYLRGQLKESPGRADIVKTAEEHIANIDSAMARNTLPKQTVYRALEHVEWYNNLDGLKGTTISDKAFISTTKSKKLASDYTLSHRKAGVIMEISLPEGAKGIDILGSEVTTKTIQRGEQEILLNRGGKFRVVDAKMVPPEGMGPDVAYIKVELIA